MSAIGTVEDREADDSLEPDEALGYAVHLHRSGEIALAETLYTRIIEASPDYADALHFYGLLKHQTGRSGEAVALVRRAIELEPDEAGMHSNLGNIFFELDRPDLAVQAFEVAIVLDPGSIDARNNLGVALRALRRIDEAEEVYREAIALEPTHREAWDNLGRLLGATGRIDEAIAAHSRALELEPRNADTRRLLVAAYAATGEFERALTLLRQWLADDPTNPAAQHLVAAISGEDVPARASDRYVETMFDSFADSFDHKLARLDYQAPQLVGGAVALACGMPGPVFEVLDAGCGTGLCGPYLKPIARRLAGIDLSANMLARAGRRGDYDELVQTELTAFIVAHPGRFDVIVSADTLCYFGSLDEVLAAAHPCLRPGGVLVFTVEEAEDAEAFRLNAHGRYSHGRDYVAGALAAAGFASVEIVQAELRFERGRPVGGLLVTARR